LVNLIRTVVVDYLGTKPGVDTGNDGNFTADLR